MRNRRDRAERAHHREAAPRVRLARLAVLALAVAGAGAHAHHSISAVYDSARQQRIEGVVAEFQFVNPHPFVIVTVNGDGGEQRWRLELDNRFELADIGVTNATLAPGDVVIATGSLGRKDRQSIYVRQLDRPADGFRYEQVGSRPRVSTVSN
jgi:hypothetical protein